jgi:hypothetical protein
MLNLTLYRAYTKNGVFGELEADHNCERLCYTVERQWKGDKRGVSCIREGVYKIRRHKSPKFGWCWIVTGGNVGVDDGSHRTHILFHAANRPSKLEGCIAPCLDLGVLQSGDDRQWGGYNSRAAMDKLHDYLGDGEHQLTIKARSYDH